MIPMHKSILTIILVVITSTNCKAQNYSIDLFYDSIVYFKTYTYSNDKKMILGTDDYFIFNNQLFNNFISADVYNLPEDKFKNFYNVKEQIKNSKYYKSMINNKLFKSISLCDFVRLHEDILRPSLSVDFLCENTEVLYLFTKKIVFNVITINTSKNLIGLSVHNKIFEKLLFPAWNGKYLIPIP